MDTNIYIACLRQVVAFAPKVIKCAAYGVAQGRDCLPPAGGRIRSQGNKMRRLRRRTREGVEVWAEGLQNDMYNNDVGKGVVYAYEAYEAK